ncbi:hypothetical protein N7468_005933 [Penicillium chermesinum]|uniref:BZIP domain-containing protein n=1 Tax=Penicillium chermesinum TaxID=63820 RepID=A0A9W9P2K4_9EURO|nr:uncharacterized protein N7468_005933 [Penicillium chermesinum]KAJ5232977.1 hypothetical protein N7468_005933 [Penicillium chermesinum]
MARFSHFDCYQAPSTLEVSPSEEEDMKVLDENILDSNSPEISDPRRASYDNEAFSHRGSVWSNYSTNSDQSRQNSHMGHSILESSASSFMPVDSTSYGQQAWNMSRNASGSCTPTAYDQYPEAEGSSSAPFAGGAVGPVGGSIPMGPVSYRSSLGFPSGSVAMSPQSSQGWAPAPMELPDAPQTKSLYRNDSPMVMRRDGVRKKNARFDIPQERNLSNIDQLISQSTNEDEVKELKQQKRLLRNRQAALDSRQRKKLHTEKLEEEKKSYAHTISQLEDMVASLQRRESDLLREQGELMNRQQHITNYVENMHLEKDEMIRVHTLETAELRKKNNILMETVDKLERGMKSGMTESHGEFAGFENLTMDNPPTQSHALSQVNDRSAEKPNNGEYPFSWNAFYMCLLFGAFIASNNTSLPGHSLPQLSEEYRAESANVLKAVLASSPSDVANPTSNVGAAAATAAAPGPSPMAGMGMAQMAGPTGSSTLDELHDTLVMPTEEQERAQVFTMNVDQYNSLTTFQDDGSGFKPAQPSAMQQALATMRNNAAQHRMNDASTSDVYSRSLMWERVPPKVIQDFRRMVQEYGAPPVKQEMGFQA